MRLSCEASRNLTLQEHTQVLPQKRRQRATACKHTSIERDIPYPNRHPPAHGNATHPGPTGWDVRGANVRPVPMRRPNPDIWSWSPGKQVRQASSVHAGSACRQASRAVRMTNGTRDVCRTQRAVPLCKDAGGSAMPLTRSALAERMTDSKPAIALLNGLMKSRNAVPSHHE